MADALSPAESVTVTVSAQPLSPLVQGRVTTAPVSVGFPVARHDHDAIPLSSVDARASKVHVASRHETVNDAVGAWFTGEGVAGASNSESSAARARTSGRAWAIKHTRRRYFGDW
jgi:hypothetical protein